MPVEPPNHTTEEDASYAYFQPSLVFYARREVKAVNEAQAIALLESPLPAYLVCPLRDWERIKAKANPASRIAARKHDLYRNLEIVVLANRG